MTRDTLPETPLAAAGDLPTPSSAPLWVSLRVPSQADRRLASDAVAGIAARGAKWASIGVSSGAFRLSAPNGRTIEVTPFGLQHMQRLLMAVNLAVRVGQFLALAPNIGGDQKEVTAVPKTRPSHNSKERHQAASNTGQGAASVRSASHKRAERARRLAAVSASAGVTADG